MLSIISQRYPLNDTATSVLNSFRIDALQGGWHSLDAIVLMTKDKNTEEKVKSRINIKQVSAILSMIQHTSILN